MARNRTRTSARSNLAQRVVRCDPLRWPDATLPWNTMSCRIATRTRSLAFFWHAPLFHLRRLTSSTSTPSRFFFSAAAAVSSSSSSLPVSPEHNSAARIRENKSNGVAAVCACSGDGARDHHRHSYDNNIKNYNIHAFSGDPRTAQRSRRRRHSGEFT